MPSGGARPGAGRPRKAEKYARQIARAEKRIADRLPELIDKAFDLSEGVPIVQGYPQVEIVVDLLQRCIHAPDQAEALKDAIAKMEKIFATPPDFRAIQYLVDRIMGKPIAKLEHTGEDGGPIEVVDVTPEERRKRIDELIAKRGRGAVSTPGD